MDFNLRVYNQVSTHGEKKAYVDLYISSLESGRLLKGDFAALLLQKIHKCVWRLLVRVPL